MIGGVNPIAAGWFARRTSGWWDWPEDRLLAGKGDATVSVVLPALDEEPTVGLIVAGIRPLVKRGLVDEIVVVDSGSVDRTAEVAAAAGATVHHRDDILPDLGSYPGKGEVLWKALAVTTGDIVVYVDADLTDFQPHFVTGLLGPLLADPDIGMVKAFYDRPLLDVSAAGGGRVTELMARPLLNAYFPDVARVVQPLAGGIRRIGDANTRRGVRCCAPCRSTRGTGWRRGCWSTRYGGSGWTRSRRWTWARVPTGTRTPRRWAGWPRASCMPCCPGSACPARSRPS